MGKTVCTPALFPALGATVDTYALYFSSKYFYSWPVVDKKCRLFIKWQTVVVYSICPILALAKVPCGFYTTAR